MRKSETLWLAYVCTLKPHKWRKEVFEVLDSSWQSAILARVDRQRT